MQSVMIMKLCTPCCLKWLRMMKLPIQMMKSPLRSLFQKILTTKPILTHKIGLDMMKKMLMTWSEIDSWLACTKDKMLKNCVAKVLKLFQRQPKFGRTLICLIYSLVKSINRCYYFKITSRLWSHAPNKIIFLLTRITFKTFQAKRKRCFIMLLVMLLV